MLTQLIVLVILLALVAAGVWAFRKSRSIQAEADEALRAMGRAARDDLRRRIPFAVPT
jgi:type II secretory pathway pseudopilin PulG